MMSNKIATGIWLVFIGIVILLYNLDIVSFDFRAMFNYWPLAIVAVGISLLFQNKPYGQLITVISNIALCTFLIIIGITGTKKAVSYGANDIPNSKSIKTEREILGNKENEVVKLLIEGGASTYRMSPMDGSERLIRTWTDNPNSDIQLEASDDQLDKITLRNKPVKNSDDNKIWFSLSEKPIWDLELNLGAANFKADLSKYKLSKLSVNSGASNLNVTIGKPVEKSTNIELNTAASNIKLYLPKEVEYYVELKNIISNNDFKDAQKINSSTYKTAHYDSAEEKIKIEMHGAANKFKIDRY